MGEAYHTIIRDDADVILAGGTEAALRSISIAGFAAMKAISTRMDAPEKASRPFDADRDGFVMGEGAGVLVLEELEHALKRGAHIYAELVGYGSTCDASHITAPDPAGDGAARAMRKAMAHAKWLPEDVDYINAHGTSTPLNDKMEALAIRSVFGEHTDKVLVNSTKSMIGHCLGAAGAIEAVATVLTIVNSYIPPTINLHDPDPECDLDYVPLTARFGKVRVAASNSFGFGGHNVSLVFSRHDG